jgi:hypothetical protein
MGVVSSKKLPLVGIAVAFVGGALVWAAAAITELGSIAAESSDHAQRARVLTDVPAWVGVAKPLGWILMAGAVVAAGVLWLRRK